MNSFGSLPVFFFACSISSGFMSRLASAMSMVPFSSARDPDARATARNLDVHLGGHLLVLLGPRLGDVDHGVRSLDLDRGRRRRGGLLRRPQPATSASAAATHPADWHQTSRTMRSSSVSLPSLAVLHASCVHDRRPLLTVIPLSRIADTSSRMWVSMNRVGLLVGGAHLGFAPGHEARILDRPLEQHRLARAAREGALWPRAPAARSRPGSRGCRHR